MNPLSAGGQGDVYLVTDMTGEFEGTWVQKRLRNLNRIDRFKREIKAGLELSHPNVVRVIDYDLEGSRPYLITEYCSGGPLAKADLSGRSTLDRLRIFAAICKGVGHAHSNKITHRDIKPDNIFLREDGTPVVGDFGICFVDEEGDRLTLLDEAVGPKNFIAPELEDGRTDDVGPWSDVYSLGKLLYWLASDKKIFSREKHREARYDLTQNQKDTSILFSYELLDRMILLDPTRRYPNANVVAEEIETAIRRILMNAHPIDIKAPQQCLYCGLGVYRVVEGSPQYEEFTPPPPSSENAGEKLWGTSNHFQLVCDHCGNVQFFRPNHAKNPNIWIKQ